MRTRLSVVVRLEGGGAPLRGVEVRFIGPGRPAARLGTATTDASGRAAVVVDLPTAPTAGPAFGRGGRAAAREHAAVAVAADGATLARSVLRAGRGGLHAVLPVPAGLALAHGVVHHKPRPGLAEKRTAWLGRWHDAIEKDPGRRVVDELCLTRALLELMASGDEPANVLQKRYDELVQTRLDATSLEAVRTAAAAGLELVDSSGLLPEPCPVESPQDVATILMRHPGVDDLVTTLKSRAAPPEETVGPVLKGTPFFRGEVELTKDCAERLAQGLLDPGVADRLTDLTTTPIPLLAPASVNYVRVYDPPTGHYVREADLHAKRLGVSELDAAELWLTADLDMDVELDSAECLVLEPDPDEPARQAMLVDVEPGRTLLLQGAGFLGEVARVTLRHRRWEDQTDDGRLVPRPPGVTVDLAAPEVEVHGSGGAAPAGVAPEDFADDQVVLPWPQEAREPGLYELTLTFANEAGYATGWSQDPETCAITLEAADPAVRLLVAVLPPRVPQRVTTTATRLDCIDETDPEPWPFFDDVQYTAQAAVLRVVLDLDDPEGTTFEDVLQVIKDGNHWFGADGEQWFPDLRLVPESGEGGRVLGLDELLAVTLSADEVEGDLDREVLRWILIAALVAVLVLVVVAAVAVVVVLFVADVITVGALTALLGIVATVATALFGVILTAGLASIDAIVSAIPAGAPILRVSPVVSGLELASRLSPVRFHRVLHLAERPDAASLSPIVQVTTIDADGLRERYRGDGLGGTYRAWLEVAT